MPYWVLVCWASVWQHAAARPDHQAKLSPDRKGSRKAPLLFCPEKFSVQRKPLENSAKILPRGRYDGLNTSRQRLSVARPICNLRVLADMDTIDSEAQQHPHAPPPPGEVPPPQPPQTPDADPPPIDLPGQDEEPVGDGPPQRQVMPGKRPPRHPWPRRSDRLYGYGGRGRSAW